MKNIEYYERAAEILGYEPETGKLIRYFKNRSFKYTGTVNSRGYLQVSITVDRKSKLTQSHRIVWYIHHGELPEILDHIDGNRSNNRIENLRVATREENMRNSKSRVNSSSQYLGVSWNKTYKKWEATIRVSGKNKYLGRFDSEIEAAKAYDAAAREHYGEFANPNFK